MSKIAIVYSSGYGHTEVIANKIAEGIQSVSGDVSVLNVKSFISGERKIEELEAFDAIIFGSPTYMGDASAEFRQFAELSSAPWFAQKWRDKFAAGFTNSGGLSGDKSNTLLTMMTLSCQHGMVWISQGITASGNKEGDLNRLGSYVGFMSQSENDTPDKTPPEGDRKTAVEFGKRIANFVKNHGRKI